MEKENKFEARDHVGGGHDADVSVISGQYEEGVMVITGSRTESGKHVRDDEEAAREEYKIKRAKLYDLDEQRAIVLQELMNAVGCTKITPCCTCHPSSDNVRYLAAYQAGLAVLLVSRPGIILEVVGCAPDRNGVHGVVLDFVRYLQSINIGIRQWSIGDDTVELGNGSVVTITLGMIPQSIIGVWVRAVDLTCKCGDSVVTSCYKD